MTDGWGLMGGFRMETSHQEDQAWLQVWNFETLSPLSSRPILHPLGWEEGLDWVINHAYNMMPPYKSLYCRVQRVSGLVNTSTCWEGVVTPPGSLPDLILCISSFGCSFVIPYNILFNKPANISKVFHQVRLGIIENCQALREGCGKLWFVAMYDRVRIP